MPKTKTVTQIGKDALKMRVLRAKADAPRKVMNMGYATAFAQAHPEYDTAKGMNDIYNMLGCKSVDETMVLKFEAWVKSVEQKGEAA